MASEKSYTPLAPKADYHKSDPWGKLSSSQQAAYHEALAHFSKEDYSIPDLEKGELMDQEKFWLSRECLFRYLRAARWSSELAIQKLEATLKWRREYGLYDTLNADSIEHEAVTGKYVQFAYDSEGRPAIYVVPSRQNTDDIDGHVRFAVWIVERGIDLMAPGVERFSLLINFAERSKKPNFGEALSIVHILQEHYPERLGLALIINVPFLISVFLKLVMPFIDPITREKIRLNPSVLEEGIFEKDMLMSDGWGGSREFEYVHEKYWPALVRMSEESLTKRNKRWRELGGTVGVAEWDYKTEPGEDVGKEGEIQKYDAGKEASTVSVVPIVA